MRIREHTKNPDMIELINETFALLGYCDPLPSPGIRILSMDGGGIRGLLVVEMLRKLEELTGKKVYELFDLICGVSTGAIIACALAVHQRELDEITYHYKKISTQVGNRHELRNFGWLIT